MITGPPENKMQAAPAGDKAAYRELPGPPQIVDRYCPACGLIGFRKVVAPRTITGDRTAWVCQGCGELQVPVL